MVLAMDKKFLGNGTPAKTKSNPMCYLCLQHFLSTSQWLTNFGWKEIFIIQLILYPGHEVVNVFWCWTFDGFLNCLTICPVVFVLWASRHDGAAFFCAKLCDCAIQHVDLIEKVNSWKRDNEDVKSEVMKSTRMTTHCWQQPIHSDLLHLAA